MKRLTTFVTFLAVLFLGSCGRETVIPEEPEEIPNIVAVDLKHDFGKNGFSLFLRKADGATRASIGDGPVFFFAQEEDVDMMYYNPSAENAVSDLSSEGVMAYHFKEEGVLAMVLPESELILKKVEDKTYNAAVIGADGEVFYLYGLIIEDADGEETGEDVRTRISGEDAWYIGFSAFLKLTAFSLQAVEVVIIPDKATGVIKTGLLEAWKSDILGMKSKTGEKAIRIVSTIDELASLANLELFDVMIAEINRLADNELAKVGKEKEDIVPPLGEEWNFRITPPWLVVPNNDARYVVPVSSKAMWKVDDSKVDKSWCTVEKSGNNLMVDIKENPNSGVHTCYATIVQAAESGTYHISPVDFLIEMEDAKFSLYPQELVFPGEGGSKAVAVNRSSNIIDWHIDKKPDWCTIEKGNNTFFIDVEPSNEGHEPEAIVVYGAINEDIFFYSEVIVSQKGNASLCPDNHHPHAIDLGLSLKWSCCNVGASIPEGYGNYYAWGETEPKEYYYWDTYKWYMGSSLTLTKYCTNSYNGLNDFTDGKTVLDPEDDAAHVNLGGKWRMPTDADWTELRTKCTWTWTTRNGVNGRLITGSNGNSIFLPAAGGRDSVNRYYTGSDGYYWSSSLSAGFPFLAWGVDFGSGRVDRRNDGRCFGRSVRPVTE